MFTMKIIISRFKIAPFRKAETCFQPSFGVLKGDSSDPRFFGYLLDGLASTLHARTGPLEGLTIWRLEGGENQSHLVKTQKLIQGLLK